MKRNSNSRILSQQKTIISSRRPSAYLDERELLTLAKAGEQDAFEQIVERYRTRLLHFITHYVGNQDEAYDVLQQVLLRFYLSLPTLSTTQSIKPWLFRVAQNCSIDALRSKRRHPALPFSRFEEENDDEEAVSLLETIADPAASPQEQLEQQEQYDRFQRAIVHLPQHFREVVVLRCRDNLRFNEVAIQLHMPESTVKTYYHRAQRLLCTMLAS